MHHKISANKNQTSFYDYIKLFKTFFYCMEVEMSSELPLAIQPVSSLIALSTFIVLLFSCLHVFIIRRVFIKLILANHPRLCGTVLDFSPLSHILHCRLNVPHFPFFSLSYFFISVHRFRRKKRDW